MNPDIQTIITAISSSKSCLLFLPQNPSPDATSAALALSLVLNREGKSSQVICPTPMTAGLSRLVGVDKVKNQLGGKNMIISFDVPEEAIEKVSYNFDNHKLNFVVEPSSGHTAPSPSQVRFSHSGLDADIIIFVGIEKEEDLGSFKDSSEIQNHPNQHYLGGHDPLSFNAPSSPLYSLDAAQIIEGLGFELDQDSAANLLAGFDASTHRLTQTENPLVFEFVAKCLRTGAIRQPDTGAQSASPPLPQFQRGNQKPRRNFQAGFSRNAPIPGASNRAPQNFPNPRPQPTLPQAPASSPEDTDPEAPAPSPDWFEPKIYKGSSMV